MTLFEKITGCKLSDINVEDLDTLMDEISEEILKKEMKLMGDNYEE